ncbi:BnaCnng38660D [Brassica napus]|uniref:non-specific serine/threonine protein kinase n=1 Tax=Brassica napus TaxID=3708 RepID=A0A078J604_BRANA|nr:BnaCnng38660D [Brassica napus]
MTSLFPSTKNHISYRIIWMIFVIPSCVYSASVELHRLCSAPFSCGNQEGLFYPFWISGREACGHPDFKLNCSGGFAEFTISSAKFIILEANSTSRVVRLARSDYTGDLCPPYPLNSPLFNEYVLPFATGTEMMTIYYGCPEASQTDSTYLGDLDCEDDDDDDEKSYYVSRNRSSLALGEICKRHVSIPADGTSLNTLQSVPTLGSLKKVIADGFKLGANRECWGCEYSKGACGYNQSSNGFVCYCIDGHQNVTCGSSSWSLSTVAKAGKKAGIGTALGLVGIILIAGGLFCTFKRRKKTQAAEYISKDLVITSSSKEASNNPTSTTVSYTDLPLLPSVSSTANRSVFFGVQVFSYEELEEATQNFSRELGDGGFGTVYYGVLKDGRAVAVKRLYERSLKHVEQFKNEVEILKSLKHQNLVILYGCTSRHSKELLLVYEYISNGTLADHLHGDRAESRPLCWSVRLNVAIETASVRCNESSVAGIIHRDVKTTNILLDENYTVKVADFGLSRLFPMDQTHVSTAPQGTPGYVDPEYFQCYRLNEKSDVYSFGVVLVELISSKEAVDITRQSHDVNLAKMAVAKIQSNALHELVDPILGFEKDPEVRRKMMSVAELAFRCLQHEREMRPTMDEILKILRGIRRSRSARIKSTSEDMEAIPF